jgi:hypothetical protein
MIPFIEQLNRKAGGLTNQGVVIKIEHKSLDIVFLRFSHTSFQESFCF